MVRKNGLDLQHTSKSLRRSKEVVIFAIQNNGIALQYAATLLKRNKDIALLIQFFKKALAFN